MTRRIDAPRGIVALTVAVLSAGPAAYAYAHDSTEPTINGTGPLGVTYAGGGSFDLPGVTLDCPPPEGGAP